MLNNITVEDVFRRTLKDNIVANVPFKSER